MHLSRRSTPAVLATALVAVTLAPAAAQAHATAVVPLHLTRTQHPMQTHCDVKRTVYRVLRAHGR